jgi:hypothetical protein
LVRFAVETGPAISIELIEQPAETAALPALDEGRSRGPRRAIEIVPALLPAFLPRAALVAIDVPSRPA